MLVMNNLPRVQGSSHRWWFSFNLNVSSSLLLLLSEVEPGTVKIDDQTYALQELDRAMRDKARNEREGECSATFVSLLHFDLCRPSVMVLISVPES
jgi:hypothetical protein